ncbi:MAG: helix-turn-helix transcriptional regulator [Lachnospiraceae bacterium]|nr:helix-turn-helix transcriptional regulator [Lachnospiraceae bacterium]
MYAMDFAQVGANIQKQLDVKGMTQQSLADALQISKQVMNKIIKGSKAINVNEIAKIAEVLSTTADDLLLVSSESDNVESMSYMGTVHDEFTRDKVDLIRTAIDEIRMLEELLDV